ncbi:MAG: hypothetical protein GQ531_01110 [Sulfurovum sp.]|nr:hypothetical protein [Sulfurovum sp.]
MKNVIGMVLALFFILGCSSKHIEVKEDRSFSSPKKSSSVLYHYAKDNIAAQGTKSGYYPLENHLDSLSARIVLAYAATKSIKLQYFTFHSDPAGKLLGKALVDAADRGVKIEILIDDIALGDHDHSIAVANDHKNISIRVFNPTNARGALHNVEIGLNSDTLGRRMHNKSFIVDNSMAVFGGRNIGDIYFGLNKDDYFVDNDILVAGPLVNKLTYAFNLYFASKFSVDFMHIAKASVEELKKGKKKYAETLASPEFKHFKKVVLNRPFVDAFRKKKLALYFAKAELYYDGPNKIGTAPDDRTYHIKGKIDKKYMPKKSFVIVNPYFIPDDEMMAHFKTLRAQGVEISVLTNSLESTDGEWVYAYYSLKQEALLKMGVKLYEIYPSAFSEALKNQAYNLHKKTPRSTLHAKTMIIDGRYFVIGSRNLDPRSRNLNTEMVAVIESVELSKHEKKVFDILTEPEHAYELKLVCDGNDNCEVRWYAVIEGKEVVFDSDGDAGFIDKMFVFFSRILPVEDLL